MVIDTHCHLTYDQLAPQIDDVIARAGAGGFVERTEVQVVEIPVTVTPATTIDPKEVTVREGRTTRTIESVTMGVEAPLTVGLLLDTSASMQKRLPDLQEAAIRFIESSLKPAKNLLSFLSVTSRAAKSWVTAASASSPPSLV